MAIDADRDALPGDEADPRRLPSAEQDAAAKRLAHLRRRRTRPQEEGAPGADSADCLAVHGLEKSIAGRKVVGGASLFVRRGEAVGLLGPHGAGKTTILYMITGLTNADRGRIELDGHSIAALPMFARARRGIGYVPQEAAIFRDRSVADNIRTALKTVEPDLRRRERELDALLEEFDIGGLRTTPSTALSSGERRRVEIARALAARPSYLLLDDPFAGIDPLGIGAMQAVLRGLSRRGLGILVAGRMNGARQTLDATDRAYVICDGEVLGTLKG